MGSIHQCLPRCGRNANRDLSKPFQPFPCCMFTLTSQGPVIALGESTPEAGCSLPQLHSRASVLQRASSGASHVKGSKSLSLLHPPGRSPRIINLTRTFICHLSYPQNASATRQLSPRILFLTSLPYLGLIPPSPPARLASLRTCPALLPGPRIPLLIKPCHMLGIFREHPLQLFLIPEI